MENNNQAEPITKLSKATKTNKLALILLILILAFVAVGATYYWQRSKVTELNTQVTSLNRNAVKLKQQLIQIEQTNKNTNESTNSAPVIGSDEQVIAAVKTYCSANVDSMTKQPLVLKVGTAGASQKQVLYSSDNNFAYVNAACNIDGTIEGNAAAYYFKKVNNTWIFLYRGQMSSPEYTKQFNIPSDFN